MDKFYAIFLLMIINSSHYIVQCSQKYPGTKTRPILSDNEAEKLTIEKYLGSWSPHDIKLPTSPDYTVGQKQKYSSVQEAVNAAILEHAHSTERQYIFIEEGVYKETVYIPSGTTPLTLYGSPKAKIVLSQSANMPVADWINQVNPNGKRYKKGDPAYTIYENCAKSQETIGTRCSTVVWLKLNAVQIVNITIENGATDGQAVALRSDAKEIQLENVNLLGHQDTFYVGSGTVYVDNSHLEGDTDFIFGEGTAVFNNCVIKSISNHKNGAVIFAPKTDASNSYGFLVINSILTCDDGFQHSSKVHLGRAWDSKVYIPGESPNGELLIRSSRIDGMINITAPWAQGAGSNRPFSANINLDRDLNDNKYNRFWEYKNYGDGA